MLSKKLHLLSSLLLTFIINNNNYYYLLLSNEIYYCYTNDEVDSWILVRRSIYAKQNIYKYSKHNCFR